MDNQQTSFIRDKSNKALLNTDKVGLAKYKSEKMRMGMIQKTQYEVESLKSEMSEIKMLLQQILKSRDS